MATETSDRSELPSELLDGEEHFRDTLPDERPRDDGLSVVRQKNHDEDDAAPPVEGWLHALRRSLDRPLTSYHLLLGVTGMLMALGLVMVLSASSVYSYKWYDGNSYVLFLRQAAWVAAALPLAWLATRLPQKALRAMVYPALMLGVILLALTYTPLGYEHGGNRNWISFGGPFQIQPSEAVKLALVLWGADLLARKEKLLVQWRHLLIPYIPVAGLVVALVLGEKDLGTAIVLFSVVLVTLYVIGMPMRYFTVAFGVVAAIVTLLVVTKGYRFDRLMGFMDPFADYENGGWQIAHAIYAFGTGGWWGVGLGASREKWGGLPEAHTDMIFAVIGEELGLAGTIVVLLLFLLLAYAGIRVALRSTDTFARIGAAGITGWLISQALVNMGTSLGLMPVAGIPLPLVSYGGSAMLATVFAVGVLVSFARNEPGARAALAAKAARRSNRAERTDGRSDGRSDGTADSTDPTD